MITSDEYGQSWHASNENRQALEAKIRETERPQLLVMDLDEKGGHTSHVNKTRMEVIMWSIFQSA